MLFIEGSSSSSSSDRSVRIFSSRSSENSRIETGSSILDMVILDSPSTSNTGSRVREAIRNIVRKPASTGTGEPTADSLSHIDTIDYFSVVAAGGAGAVAGAGTASVIGGHKPSLSDKIRKITSGGGGSGFSSNTYGSGYGGTSGGSGSHAWVTARYSVSMLMIRPSFFIRTGSYG
jgi:hypothetical protein